MKLTRRNALIGMGTVAAGAGVIGGTGAFTSVQADRSVSVTTEGDGGAALGIVPATQGSGASANATQNAQDYTNANADGTLPATDDTFQITIGSGSDAGLNIDAVTKIEDLFDLVNNSSNEVIVDFQIDSVPSGMNNPKLLVGSTSYTLETGSNWVPGSGSKITIGSGSTSSKSFGIAFDIGESAPQTFNIELTIRAQDNS